jgi:hypothetical protein
MHPDGCKCIQIGAMLSLKLRWSAMFLWRVEERSSSWTTNTIRQELSMALALVVTLIPGPPKNRSAISCLGTADRDVCGKPRSQKCPATSASGNYYQQEIRIVQPGRVSGSIVMQGHISREDALRCFTRSTRMVSKHVAHKRVPLSPKELTSAATPDQRSPR